MVALALAHGYFARLLNWSEDLQRVSPINRQVFYAHTIFIVCGLILLGMACLFFPTAMIERSLLATIASGSFACCWLSRLVCQFVLFTGDFSSDPKLNRLLRTASTLLWIYYTGVFSALFAYQMNVLRFS